MDLRVVFHADHGFVVATAFPFPDSEILLDLHLGLDVDHVVLLALLDQCAADLLVLFVVEDVPPVLSPNKEPSAEAVGLVDVLGSLVAAQVVGSDQKVVFDAKDIVLETVDFEAEVERTAVEEDHLIYFVKLVEEDALRMLVSRLQGTQ